MIQEQALVLSLAVLGISRVMLLKAELAGLEACSPPQVETGVCGSCTREVCGHAGCCAGAVRVEG